MNAVGKTDKGLLRRINQDCIKVISEPVGKLPNLFIIADGMGGHRAGEVASQKAIEYFCEFINSNISESGLEDTKGHNFNDTLDTIISALTYANNMVFEQSSTNPELSGMGSTLTAVVVGYGKVTIAHVGDSRAYFISEAGITQLTDDHSYVNELLKAGRITAEQARNHPNKNVMTRAVGTDLNVQIDGIVQQLNSTGYILLCSDGLTNMVPDEDIRRIVTEKALLGPSLKQKCDNLIHKANHNGGADNISVILIEIQRENLS